MKWRVFVGPTIFLAVAHLAVATPPPPPPAKYTESWNAIEALTPYLGEWTGTEIDHGGVAGQLWKNERRVFWAVSRLGGKDVVLFEHGASNSPPFIEFDNLLTYDTSTSSYRMFLAGYRLFTGSDRTSELAPLVRDPGGRLSWSATMDDGSKRRTTIWLDGGAWHETVVEIGADGTITPVSEATLTKS